MIETIIFHDRRRPLSDSILKKIESLSDLAAWLIIPIVAVVVLSVLISLFDIGKIIEWDSNILLFGDRLTAASLGDLQWHLFGLMLMFTFVGATIKDSHVRVDFLRQNMPDKAKCIVDIVGHLIFLLPFSYVLVDHGWDFTVRSLNLNEGSDYDGLYDRFLIKGTIPLGFLLLIIVGVLLTFNNIKKLYSCTSKGDK